MHTAVQSSTDLIDGLVREYFGIEPDVLAALARGDEQVLLRRLPMTEPTTNPLDGVETLMRRTVDLSLKLRRHSGVVALTTERQAAAAGWPSARLANLCIVLAYALAATGPAMSTSVLVEADEDAGDVMVPLIRVDVRLPPLAELLDDLRKSDWLDIEVMDQASEAPEPAAAHVGLVALDGWLTDRLGIDVETVELPIDRCGPRLEGRSARAVACLAWLVTTAVDLGCTMEADGVEAVRIKTEQDARVAGEPGSALANLALLLGAAIYHGTGSTVHVLPPNTDFAEALVEDGELIRREGTYRDGDAEMQTVVLFDLEDLATRGYVHVGRQAVKQVAWRQVRDDA